VGGACICSVTFEWSRVQLRYEEETPICNIQASSWLWETFSDFDIMESIRTIPGETSKRSFVFASKAQSSNCRHCRTVYPNLSFLPYPLIRLFIYKYPPLQYPRSSLKFFFNFLRLNNQTTQINLMTFIGFHFLSYFSFFYSSSLHKTKTRTALK
jgi:hypothetical protein